MFMKLTVGTRVKEGGFALPTILLVSTVMLIVLTASIAATAASRVSLDSQYYNQLAQQAAQSGVARANECLKNNGYSPQWSTLVEGKELRPDSDCTGATMTGSYVSAYVVGQADGSYSKVRTRYIVEAPSGTGVGSILRVDGTTELVRTSAPHNVWRSYKQSLYLRIEPPETIACPEGFVAVPGDSRFGTNDFCISKYEAKNVGGKAASQAGGLPYAGINQADAATVAANACAGCHLISEAEWLTVAHNVIGVSSNWSGSSVGSGYMYSGHSDSGPANLLAASTDDNDGYYGTGDTSPSNQRRTLTLSNGEVVWDLAGNAWEWTSGSTAGGQPGGGGLAMREWKDVGGTGSLNPNPFPSFGTPAASGWTGSNGIGRLYSDSSQGALRGFFRGGSWNNGSSAGVFMLDLSSGPTSAYGHLGFRIAFKPLSEMNCSEGFVPVPGNSMFSTNNFCIGKYEAKYDGGVAKSQAAGTPWTNISQTSAITAANNACVKCRLINEGEWLTVAHNILNTASNWSGGSVGSGYVYTGHNDDNPSGSLVAGTDDSNGYFGTGNASGNQRRTLTLNNGQVIWDFAGNVWEWTSGQITGGQPGGSGFNHREWNAITDTGLFSPDPFPSFGTPAASNWTSVNGIGKIYSTTSDAGLRGFIRGGNWNEGSNAGIFGLALSAAPSSSDPRFGFRMVEVK